MARGGCEEGANRSGPATLRRDEYFCIFFHPFNLNAHCVLSLSCFSHSRSSSRIRSSRCVALLVKVGEVFIILCSKIFKSPSLFSQLSGIVRTEEASWHFRGVSVWCSRRGKRREEGKAFLPSFPSSRRPCATFLRAPTPSGSAARSW